jgi:hypothetical protein
MNPVVKMNALNTLAGKPEDKIPLGRHMRRLEYNIKMKQLFWVCLKAIYLDKNMGQWRALVSMVINI